MSWVSGRGGLASWVGGNPAQTGDKPETNTAQTRDKPRNQAPTEQMKMGLGETGLSEMGLGRWGLGGRRAEG